MTTDTKSFDTSAASDPGMRRRDNQDSFARADKWLGPAGKPLRDKYGRLYVVADGVGGNDDGGRASKLVAKSLMEFFYNDPAAPEIPLDRLRYAIMRTSRAVHSEAARIGSNMASTVVAALLHNDKLIIANVGDSPALLFRPDSPAKYLTIDHVVARADGSRPLSQSMGDIDVNVAFFTTNFRPGDVLVLCTDGLTDLVSNDEIGGIATRQSAREAGRALIQLANARGGPDNITALVVRNGRLSLLQQGRFYFAAALLIAVLCVSLLLWWVLAGRLGTVRPLPITTSITNSSEPTHTAGTSQVVVTGPTAVTGLVADPPTSTPLPSATPTSTPTATPTSTPTSTPTHIPTRTPVPRPPTATALVGETAVPTTLAEPTSIGVPGEQRRFTARIVMTFPETGASGQAESCVQGQVLNRNGEGVAGAVVQTNNGKVQPIVKSTDNQGSYLICGLGQSLWSVVLVFVPSQENPSVSSLTTNVIALINVNGSPEQKAVVHFVEQ